jgi:hypothetical protein
MDTTDTMTTQQVRRAGISAACIAILGASSILEFYIVGEDTWEFWMWFSVIPIAIYLWVVFIRRVQSLRLLLFAIVGSIVILLVGWYRTDSWVLVGLIVSDAAFGGWKIWRHLQTKD